jgi:hypothetical protein
MKISRRNFLGAATGVTVATLCSFRAIGSDTLASRTGRERDCVLLDLNSNCALPESLRGYQTALVGEHHSLAEVEFGERRCCRMVIVPGLGAMDPAMARTLWGLLQAGTSLVLESGAGFLCASEFAAHQKTLNRYFGITIGSPIDLWPAAGADNDHFPYRQGQRSRTKPKSRESVPYVHYLWPQETNVRDFSRVVPVLARERDVIGKVGALPVALKRRVAEGTLIFLGSPIGPALRAGDPQALSWLRLVTARVSSPSTQTPDGVPVR